MAHHWRTTLYVCSCRNSAFCKDLTSLRFRCIKTGVLLQKLISPHCKLITCELKSVNNFQTISLKLNNYVSFFLDYIPNLYNVISAHYALRHIFFCSYHFHQSSELAENYHCLETLNFKNYSCTIYKSSCIHGLSS